MNPTPKIVPLFSASTTNGATQSANVDTLGYDRCQIIVIEDASNAATNNPSVLKVSESDDTVVTNFANVSGLVGDTDFTIANSVTSGIQAALLADVDCRKRKRYLKVSVSPTTTQVLTAVAVLSRADEMPNDATGANVGALARV